MNRRIRRKKNFLSNIIDKIKDGLNEVEGNKIKGIDSADDKRREMLVWCACIVGSILLAFLTIKFVFEKTEVLDDSMSKTLKRTDNVLVNKLAYLFSDPDRYDVIVFKQEDKGYNYYNIKRVIGMPKEKVSIKKGHVFVNGEQINEKIDVDKCNNPGLADSEIELGDDEYFVLGDNRNNSEDSRFANIGVIKEDDLIGSAWLKIDTLSLVKNLNNVEDSKEEK